MREMVIEWALREKLVAIVRGVESEKCLKVAQALYDGGIRLMEVTYDQKNPDSWKQTAQAIGDIAKAFEGKMLMCGCIGILVATIGIDSVTSYIRFCPEGNYNFMGGISYIPIMIGLFAMSQAFENIEEIFKEEEEQIKVTNILLKKEDLKVIFKTAPVTGLVGTLIGIIPGAGADIGAFVGYNVARGLSDKPEDFGNGSIYGISGPEGGNNGVTGGDPTVFFSTVICWFFIILIVVTLFGGQAKKILFKKKAAK